MTLCPFDVDVFLFAMVYYKIFSKSNPFDDCRKDDILKRIRKGERSKLPSNCNELMELIKEY